MKNKLTVDGFCPSPDYEPYVNADMTLKAMKAISEILVPGRRYMIDIEKIRRDRYNLQQTYIITDTTILTLDEVQEMREEAEYKRNFCAECNGWTIFEELNCTVCGRLMGTAYSLREEHKNED